MAEANVRRRGTGDPEATLDLSRSKPTTSTPKIHPLPGTKPLRHRST